MIVLPQKLEDYLEKNKTMASMSLSLKLEVICENIVLKMISNRPKCRKMAKFMISLMPLFVKFCPVTPTFYLIF